MRVMVLVKATDISENEGASPQWMHEMLAAMGRFNQELRQAGVFVAAEGLRPTSGAKRVVFNGRERTVIDGPFGQTRELVAGYWIWEVKDMNEAVSWAMRCPNPMPVPSEVEIRPFYD